MKKIIIFIAALGLFAAASCQKEKAVVIPNEGEEATAVISIAIPEDIATKVYSDGTSATKLQYAVYRADNGEFLFENQEELTINLKREVEIRLVKNFAYDIVFWAQHPDAPYTFSASAKTVTVNDYTSGANDEKRDAFYQLVEDYVYVPTTTTVELYRPFAQINFGASDYAEVTALLGDDCMTSKADITGLPNVLNVLDRTATGSVDATFTATAVPAQSGEKLTVNGVEYGYVSMNYVLAPQEKAVLGKVTGTFYYNNDNVSLEVANVPYQRNYRTNIIGEFFTGPAHFIVEIIPIYDEPAYLKIFETVVVDAAPSSGEVVYENVNLVTDGAVAEVNASTALWFVNSSLKAGKGILLNEYSTVVLYNCEFTLPDGEYAVIDNTADPTTWVYYDQVSVNGVTVDSSNWDKYFKVANAIHQNFN